MEQPLTMSLAYITWVQGEEFWSVKDQQGKTIFKFPKEWDEKQCMAIIHFCRKYELEAYNQGVFDGKAFENGLLNAKITGQAGQILSLEAMNDQLSTELERHITMGGTE